MIRPEQFTCAARLLRERGHCKRSYQCDDGSIDTAWALLLARQAVDASYEEYEAARRHLMALLGTSLTDFNDAPETTLEVAAAALERAAREVTA